DRSDVALEVRHRLSRAGKTQEQQGQDRASHHGQVSSGRGLLLSYHGRPANARSCSSGERMYPRLPKTRGRPRRAFTCLDSFLRRPYNFNRLTSFTTLPNHGTAPFQVSLFPEEQGAQLADSDRKRGMAIAASGEEPLAGPD